MDVILRYNFKEQQKINSTSKNKTPAATGAALLSHFIPIIYFFFTTAGSLASPPVPPASVLRVLVAIFSNPLADAVHSL